MESPYRIVNLVVGTMEVILLKCEKKLTFSFKASLPKELQKPKNEVKTEVRKTGVGIFLKNDSLIWTTFSFALKIIQLQSTPSLNWKIDCYFGISIGRKTWIWENLTMTKLSIAWKLWKSCILWFTNSFSGTMTNPRNFKIKQFFHKVIWEKRAKTKKEG